MCSSGLYGGQLDWMFSGSLEDTDFSKPVTVQTGVHTLLQGTGPMDGGKLSPGSMMLGGLSPTALSPGASSCHFSWKRKRSIE